MTRRKHKTLLTFLICSALIGTGSAASAAVMSQADADRVDSALATGSHEITDSFTRQDRNVRETTISIGQVFSQNGPIVINEGGSADHTLKMTLDANVSENPDLSHIGNIVSDGADRTAAVKNLQSLDLHLSGVRILDGQKSYRSNILAANGGTVVIDASVKNLEASSIRTDPSDAGAALPLKTVDANIAAVSGGTAKVYSPVMKLHMKTGYNFTASDTRNDRAVGIYADGGGHVTAGAGSGAGEGMFLTGSKDYLSAGFRAVGDNSVVDVTSGNIEIDRCDTGAAAEQRGTINLGTADSPVNRIAIHNASSMGLQAYTGGTVNVQAKNLDITDNIRTSVTASRNGNINIHTSGAAVLRHGQFQQTIWNMGGRVAVNADPHDGATNIIGEVRTEGAGSVTELGFHTPDSYFYGNVFDVSGAKTTVHVSNGANFIMRPAYGMTSSRNNSLFDTLDIAGTGIVNLSGNGSAPYYEGSYGMMTTANVQGDGGTLIFKTKLQESADTRTVNKHSDQLIITNSSSGIHHIMINDYSSQSGSPVNDGYVLLVKDQSARPGAIFRGRADLQNGGLFAQPVEITNQAPDPSEGYTDVPESGNNWYLRMAREQPEEPAKPTWNAKNNVTFARSRYGALWIEQDTLRQRVGELRNHTQDDGIWARIDRGEYSMNGVNGSADYIRYHIGYDKQIGSQKGQKQYIGMAYHHTDTDLNYRHFTDDSDMDADIGTIYYTNLQDKGHYLDIVGKFGRMKGKMKTFGDFPESAKWDSPFYSVSAEYGRKVMYKNDWYVEPQAQLTYSHLGSDSYLTSQGTHAHVDGINSLIFRTGFAVGKKDGQNEYYGKVFWHHEFEGAEDARFHDKNDDSLRDSYDFGGSWVTVGLGGQVGIGKNAYLYGDVDKSFGGDVKKKWAWNVGVRFGF